MICIDFGSAYTKVAIRPGWDEPAQLTRDTPFAADDATFCIPSVVAKVERNGSAKWIVGQEAAQQKRGDGVTVFEHFKAKMLSAESSEREFKPHRGVGVVFFKQLRTAIGKTALGASVDEFPARLCIPKLEHNGRTEERMRDILSEAGWTLASRPMLFEPESNALGVFTRGKNATHFPVRHGEQSRERHPHLAEMFDAKGLLAAIRGNILQRPGGESKTHFGVVIVDVGAFTTDFGYIKFECDASFERPPEIVQLSSEIGVRQLDDAVRAQLRPEVKSAVSSASTTRWERAKRELYSGGAAAILNPKGGVFEIGTGQEAKTIAEALRDFAQRIVQSEQQFRRGQMNGPLDAYVLTGGGALIPMVREVLIEAAKKSGVRRIYDLQDEEEHKRGLLKKWDGASWHLDRNELDSRRSHNYELMRGGSAMGGCSVFFESGPPVKTA